MLKINELREHVKYATGVSIDNVPYVLLPHESREGDDLITYGYGPSAVLHMETLAQSTMLHDPLNERDVIVLPSGQYVEFWIAEPRPRACTLTDEPIPDMW